MSRIIVGIPERETGIQIRNLLVRNGFDVIGVCTFGTQILDYTDFLEEGIVICASQLKDMMYGELRTELPLSFEMLVLTTESYPVEEGEHIRTLSMPLKVQELLRQVQEIEEEFERQRRKRNGRKSGRNERQNQIILKAKEQLMEQKKMSEEEAHRYLQKYSMESGSSLTETAQMMLQMMEGMTSGKENGKEIGKENKEKSGKERK